MNKAYTANAGIIYDVLVAGGGLAGTFAAIAAARKGARVALFEQYGFLGGMATAAPVSLFMQYHVLAPDGSIPALVHGLFEEMVNRLKSCGAILDSPFSFDDIVLRGVLDEMVSEAQVDVFFHTFVFGAEVKDNRICAIRWVGKEGEQRTSARVFIDATGDGALAHAAGSGFTYGRADGKAQPMTPMFLIAGVDLSRLPDGIKGINTYLKAAHARGQSEIARVGCWLTPHPDMLLFNTTHIWNCSGLNVVDVSRAEMEGRRQIMGVMTVLRSHVPGFENAYIARAGAQIGVRETRHLLGRYTLTREDILGGRKFEDGIARASFEIDIHPLSSDEKNINLSLKPGVFYEVPYRCLLPAKGPSNVLVACRALSATHEAHASLRIMPTMSAVGEAAGLAAAEALSLNGDVTAVNGTALKTELCRMVIMGG